MESDLPRRYVSRKTFFALTLLIVLWGPGTPAVMMLSGNSEDPFWRALIFPSFYAAQGLGALLAGFRLSRIRRVKRLIVLSILIDTVCSCIAVGGEYLGGLSLFTQLCLQSVSGLATGIRLPTLVLLVRNASEDWEFPRRLAWAGVAMVMAESLHWIRILSGPLLGVLQGELLQGVSEELDFGEALMPFLIFLPVVFGTVIRLAALVPLYLLDTTELSSPPERPAAPENSIPAVAWMTFLRLVTLTILQMNTLLLFHQKGAQSGMESMYSQLLWGMLIEVAVMLLIYWRGGLRRPLRAFAFCFCCLMVPPLLLAYSAGVVPLPVFQGWINSVTLIAAIQWLEPRTRSKGWFIPAIGVMVCCENLLSASLALIQQPLWKWNSTVVSYFLTNELGIPLALTILGIVLSLFCWRDKKPQAEPHTA